MKDKDLLLLLKVAEKNPKDEAAKAFEALKTSKSVNWMGMFRYILFLDVKPSRFKSAVIFLSKLDKSGFLLLGILCGLLL